MFKRLKIVTYTTSFFGSISGPIPLGAATISFEFENEDSNEYLR